MKEANRLTGKFKLRPFSFKTNVTSKLKLSGLRQNSYVIEGEKIQKLAYDVIPAERIKGSHISKYATLLRTDQDKYKKQFSNYLKINFNPEEFENHFLEIKNKILKGN